VPGSREPESAIIGCAADEADGADDLAGILLEAQGPVPLVAARHGGQSLVAIVD